MERLRDLVIKCLHDVENDEQLIRKLNDIIDKEGWEACQVIFHVLTHLELELHEAKESWADILSHHKNLSTILGREVSLRTAICDFFCSNRSLKSPKVVEIHIFEKTIRASRYDGLTGLFNRSSFDEEFTREISRAKRYDQVLSLLFFDLDDFKTINDSFGHQAGDLVLKKVADIIIKEKRAEDIAARYGGEEMVLILPRTETTNALVVGERIRAEVEKMRIPYSDEMIHLTLSGGLASFPVNADDIQDLIKCADQALYSAKGSGKNKISFFSPDNRRYFRIELIRKIKVSKLGFLDIQTINTKSKNISMGGVLFESDDQLEVGTKVQISLPIDDKTPFLILGTIVRVDFLGPEGYDIGVSMSLEEIDKIAKSEISRLLQEEIRTA